MRAGLPITMPHEPAPTPTSWKRIPYNDEPDFTRPLLDIPDQPRQRMYDRLRFLYGDQIAHDAMPELARLIRVHHAHKTDELIAAEEAFRAQERFSEQDMILITYGDMISANGQSPLVALARVLNAMRRRAPIFNTLHILPFFPYTSDRGFSITDFRIVDPHLGTWDDIEKLGETHRLMFDGVFNHASSRSPAFREMLCGNPDYRDYAITFQTHDELTPEQRLLLRRPRTSDILTQFHSINGPLWTWTTFSPDQIDLNYRNPRVLLSVVDTLLLYVRRSADLIRLDAVTYLWYEPGSSGANLEQTHQIIKLLREVFDVAAPHVTLVTETNVPHEENVSYFGDGFDEAQMVYNFALPPLVLHAFYRGDATALSCWARDLTYPSPTTTYLNILDTHDGIGLPGVANLLPAEEIQFLIEQARHHGAFISYRTVEGGGEAPYEINTTWYSALNMDNSGEERTYQVKRFAASRSIALALKGIPGVYVHGLLGTRNDIQLALRTRGKRDVNRATVDEAYFQRMLAEPGSKMNLIQDQLGRLLEMRVRHRAFHPNGGQKVLLLSPIVFAVLRTSPEGHEHILAITNVSERSCRLEIPLEQLGIPDENWYDLVSCRGWAVKSGKLPVELGAYDVRWLMPFGELERSIESGPLPSI